MRLAAASSMIAHSCGGLSAVNSAWRSHPGRDPVLHLRRAGVRQGSALEGTGLEERAPELARLAAGQVDLIVSALRATRRVAVTKDKARRKQRTADRRQHRWIEYEQYADMFARQAAAMGHRAGGDLGALQRLAQHYDDGTFVMGLAVSGLQARGYSDAEIAGALGVTRQAVSQRWPWQRDLARPPGAQKPPDLPPGGR
jgi:hypothetical protein